MATAGELAGIVELAKWSTIPGGFEVLLEPTKKIRRFHVRVRPKPPRVSKVKHYKPLRKGLQEGSK